MKTKHEKILKRTDGSRVRITATLVNSHYDEMHYGVMVHVCEKGKRTWTSPYDPDDYRYRRLSMEEREKYRNTKHLTVASVDEQMQTKLELWEKLKPCQAA